MKKKGFTLIELLGVIIILGILTLVVFPLILKQINNAKQGIKDANDVLIIDGAKDYYEDNKQNFTKIDGISYCIDISTLKENNYINSTLKNEDNENIDTSKIVKLTYLNNLFNYKIVDECTVSLTRNGIEVPIEQEVLTAGLYASTIDEGRYIYRGANPNNYIWLDENGDGNKEENELYRIISFESDGTVKVIRNNSIGKMAWDVDSSKDYTLPWNKTKVNLETRKYVAGTNEKNSYCTANNGGCNVWGTQNNTYFKENSLDAELGKFKYKYYLNNNLETLQYHTNEGTITEEASLNILLNNYWINSLNNNVQALINVHKFNVGGIGYNDKVDTEDKGIEKEKEEQNIYTWTGKIGLMNITDFVESSLNDRCTSVWSNVTNNDNVDLKESGDWPCKYENGNWMDKHDGNMYWTLSPNSITLGSVWIVYAEGQFSYDSTKYSISVRPSFYLKPTIVLDGVGTEVNPYKIK